MLGGDGGRAQAGLPDRAAATGRRSTAPSRACARASTPTRSSCTTPQTTTGDDAVAACNAMGLFGAGTRLIVVEGVEAWKAPDAKAIADVPEVADAGHDARARRRRAEEGRAAREGGRAARGEVLLWDVAAEGRRRAGSPSSSSCTATSAEPEACRLLAELVGDDLYELAGEVDKLATWADGERDHGGGRRAARRAARRLAAVEPHRRLGRARRRRRAARGRADARPHGRPASRRRSRASSAA